MTRSTGDRKRQQRVAYADHPVLAYVAWRDAFDTAPVWRDANPA